jgi:NADH:ubiquinone oxidoreductase subunit F (NADH-binding)
MTLSLRAVGQPSLLAGTERSSAPVDLAHHRWLHGERRPIGRAALQNQLDSVRLLGRGGAAFPVGRKLDAIPAHGLTAVVVNGSEGEPASYKDRALLTHVPHLVIDGALAVADAIAARTIHIDIHDERAAQIMREAVSARGDSGRVHIVLSPSSFVAGEATAAISRLDGGAGAPDGRRTLPTERGVRGRPTFLSNVETFAQIALLVQHGANAYLRTGLNEEPGTSLFTVMGAVTSPSVVEAPNGIPLSVLLDTVGCANPAAVLIGGYHGSWWTEAGHPAAYQISLSRPSLRNAGASLGAGSVCVLPSDTCPLGETARVAQWLAAASVGQCGPCLFGLPALAADLDQLIRGDQTRWPALGRHLDVLPGRGACAHPDGAVRFVSSAIRHFWADIELHSAHATCGRPVLGVLPLPETPVGSARAIQRTAA